MAASMLSVIKLFSSWNRFSCFCFCSVPGGWTTPFELMTGGGDIRSSIPKFCAPISGWSVPTLPLIGVFASDRPKSNST
jgi:hypothetical protein